MPTITDWLMVGITAVYVVATIIISCANIKSANATREQLTESKRQYEDKKRLEIMPYIQFEATSENLRTGGRDGGCQAADDREDRAGGFQCADGCIGESRWSYRRVCNN